MIVVGLTHPVVGLTHPVVALESSQGQWGTGFLPKPRFWSCCRPRLVQIFYVNEPFHCNCFTAIQDESLLWGHLPRLDNNRREPGYWVTTEYADRVRGGGIPQIPREGAGYHWCSVTLLRKVKKEANLSTESFSRWTTHNLHVEDASTWHSQKNTKHNHTRGRWKRV